MIIETPKTRDIIKSLNYNVKLVFGFSIIGSLGNGVWGTAFSMYIYFFAGEAEGFFGLSQSVVLGLTAAVRGITMLVFLFPAGYFADKFRRDVILKIAAIIGIITLGLIAFGNSFLFIFISLFFLGLFSALVSPSIEAIFADSVVSGYRSKIYSWRQLLNQIGSGVGPFIAAILFAIIGNEWNLALIKYVMYGGFGIYLLAILLLMLFKDELGLGKESEAIAEEVTEVVEEQKSRLAINIDSERAIKLIPILLVSFSFIVALGAGMSVQFFPVFFAEEYFVSPVWLNIIMGATSIVTGLFGLIFQKVSLKFGRIQTIFLTHYLATAFLLIFAVYPPLGVLVPFYILRGSFMNGNRPLSKSILMDIIKKKNRGIWNSFDIISWGLFWNASAVLGGFLVGDNNNFNLCFIITTFVYIVATVPIVIMMPLVGKEREAKDREDVREGEAKNGSFTKLNEMKTLDSEELSELDYLKTTVISEEATVVEE